MQRSGAPRRPGRLAPTPAGYLEPMPGRRVPMVRHLVLMAGHLAPMRRVPRSRDSLRWLRWPAERRRPGAAALMR